MVLGFNSFNFFDASDRIGNDSEVFEAEKIKFQEAGFLNGIHIVLGNDFSFAFGIELERGIVGKRRWGDNHAGGVHANMTGATFNFLCHVNDSSSILFLAISGFQLGGFFQGPFNGHGKALRAHWDEFGYSIADFIWESYGACYIAHG